VTNTLYLLAAVLVGVCAATQAAMLGSIGREKSPYEAMWIKIAAAAIAGIAPILVVRFSLGLGVPILRAEYEEYGLSHGRGCLPSRI
jgi:hypothetical protein